MDRIVNVKIGFALIILIVTALASGYLTYIYIHTTERTTCLPESNLSKPTQKPDVKPRYIPSHNGKRY